MLHIILLILKIIGIILLCILGILLLAILCVLFVPVRYRIELERKEGEGEPPFTVHARITWLMHIVNVRIRYPSDKAYVRVRLFLFTLLRVPDGKERQAGHKKRPPGKREDKTAPDGSQRQPEAIKAEPETSTEQADNIPEPEPESRQKQEIQQKPEADPADTGDAPMHPDPTPSSKKEEGKPIPTVTIRARNEEAIQAERSEEKTSFREKLSGIAAKCKNFFHKIKDLIQNIEYTIRNICDKIKSVSDQIGYYREVIAGDAFRSSFRLCKGELASIVKSLKPQKLRVNLTIGMDDPAATAEILAFYGMLYPVIGEYVDITGDFDRKRIEGCALIKGRIRAFTFVKTAIRVYFNKDIKKLIKLFKKEAA